MTPRYVDDWLTIYQGDCRAVLAELEPESVHCVVTSPPYWGLRDYGTATWIGGDADCDHVQRNARGDSGRPATMVARGAGGAMVASGASLPVESPMQFKVACGRCGAVREDDQIGLEPTPEAYVASMVDVFRSIRRVLRRDGTAWLNLGDSFAGSWGAQSRREGEIADGLSAKQIAHHPKMGSRTGARGVGVGGLKAKDLVGIPWRVAFALQADGWYLRRDIIWAKPNPMPESITDRPTSSHEYVFLLTKSARYYYDSDAVREVGTSGPSDVRKMVEGRERIGGKSLTNGDPLNKANAATNIGQRRGVGGAPAARWPGIGPQHAAARDRGEAYEDMDVRPGRNLRSVWTIATQPYPGAHFATFPRKLVEPCILAGTSARGVCPECGAPWKRIVERTNGSRRGNGAASTTVRISGGLAVGAATHAGASEGHTTGWQPGCAHDLEPVPATVLDPFGGSGTTGVVAQALNRRAILVDLNADYLAQAIRRASRHFGVGGPELVDDGTSEPPADSLWAIPE